MFIRFVVYALICIISLVLSFVFLWFVILAVPRIEQEPELIIAFFLVGFLFVAALSIAVFCLALFGCCIVQKKNILPWPFENTKIETKVCESS